MPFAQFTATGNGSTKQFTIPFPYVKKDHIVVALNNVANTSFSFINDTTIEFDTLSSATSTQEATGAPKTGVTIEIERDTPLTNALVDFVDGSTLTAADLDTAVLQLLYGIQEAKDEAALGIQRTPQGQDAKNQPIINVSDPTNAQDAVTKAFLERVGSITSTQIADGSIVNADVNASAAIDGTKISPDFGSQNIATSGTVDGRDVSADGTKLDGIESGATADQTNAEIKTAYEANSDTNNFTDALLAKLNAIEANATTDQTISEIKALIAGSPLDDTHLAANSVGNSEIANSSVTNNKLADAELVTLAGMQSGTASKLADSTALTSDIADLNQLDGMAKQTTISDDDTKFPTSGAVVDYVAAQIAPIGGLEVIANEDSFPTTQPLSGVVISIADIEGLIVDGSGVATNARTTGNGSDNVTINGFPSSLQGKTMAAGLGLMVSSTGSSQTYTYHKLLAKEADVEQLSNDINDFAARYRVTEGEPTSDNDEGDLIYDKNADKMKVYDSSISAFKEVTSVGDFKFLFLCPAGGSGAPTIDDSTSGYDLRENSNTGAAASVTNAAQLLVSINGVVQKPNAGTSAPTEGFVMVDSNSILFSNSLPTGAEVFIIQIGSAIALQVPADNTVSSAKLQNGSVTTAKIASSAVGNTELANNAVGTAKIADDAVTTAKINSNAVTVVELAANAVNTNKIIDANVTTAKIADDAVTNAKIASMAASKLTGALPAIDGSNLTGLSGLSVANQADNRLLTATGTTDSLNAEANLTYDGNELKAVLGSNSPKLTLKRSGNVDSADNIFAQISAQDANGAVVGELTWRRETANDESYLDFETKKSGVNNAQPSVRIKGSNGTLYAVGNLGRDNNNQPAQMTDTVYGGTTVPSVISMKTRTNGGECGLLVRGASQGGGSSDPHACIRVDATSCGNNADQYGIYTRGRQQLVSDITGYYATVYGSYSTTYVFRGHLDKHLGAYTNGYTFHSKITTSYSGGNAYHFRGDSGTTQKIRIEEDGDIDNSNNSYGGLSDVKLKENIVDANSQWDDLKALKVRNFNFKDDPNKVKMLGLVAQEAEIVSAGLVKTEDDVEIDPSTGEGKVTGQTKYLKYSILYMKAIKALQEAMVRIETLEAKVTTLEGS